jgi:DamX protein
VLQERSGGNIAEINTLTAALLSFDASAEKSGFEIKIPLAHLVAIVILVVTVGYVYWYLGIGEDAGQQPVAAALPEAQISGSDLEPLPVLQDREASADSMSERQAVAEQASPMAEVASLPPAVDVDATGQGAYQPSIRSVVVEAAPPERAIAIEPPIVAAPEPSIVSAEAAADVAVPAPPIAAIGGYSPAEQALLALPVEFYMLQLTGTASESRIRQFVATFSPQLRLSYIKLWRNGEPWYVALVGPHPDRPAAQQAVKSLPEALRREQPWVRRVASLQQALAASRQ